MTSRTIASAYDQNCRLYVAAMVASQRAHRCGLGRLAFLLYRQARRHREYMDRHVRLATL